jgi:hypothetical protein
MKKLLQLLFLFVISASSFSQSLTQKMTGILNQMGKNIPADQLFLHIDRNLYHAGDTIRFQAYIRDRQTGVFETESSALYALLLNSNHVTTDSARFRIINSISSGWLKVPEAIPPGDYSILAFTSSDMNFSPEFAFTVPIKINNLQPSQNVTKTQSKDKDSSLHQVSLPQTTIDLAFLPEGGTFIFGILQRLAFNAVTSTGKSLEVAGVIINQRGVEITKFTSTKYGPGVVEFTPLPGDYYFATVNGEEFKGLKWPLPVPEKSGVTMRVNNAGNGLIDIILNGSEIAGTSYFLTITMNNILVFSEDVRLDTLFRKSIQTDKLPSGTAFVTLYDHELNPIAERLIFLNEYKKMNVEIGVSSPSVNRGDETELTVNTTDDKGNNISSIVSIAVIDSISGYNKEIPLPEIESAYLYDKEFYNNLPFNIKSRGLKNIDSQSIDVLLMTYGWRKFTPKEVTISNPEKELVNYDFLKITNPGPEKKGMSDIKILTIEELDSISLLTDKNREAVLFYDSLDVNVRQIMIMPDKNPVKNINPVKVEFPENKYFTEKAKLLTPDTSYITSDLEVVSKKQPDIDLDNAIMIEPVTIKAPNQPSKVYVDKYAKMFQSVGTSTIYSIDFVAATCFEDILYTNNPYTLNKNNKTIYLRSVHYRMNGNLIPALIVLDNTAIDTTYETIATMPASEIASVTFLRGIQGFSRFGWKAISGVVFVTTKTGNGLADGGLSNDMFRRNDDLLKQVRLFRTEIEYYIPTKEEVALMPEFQFRPTVLWKNEVFIDESGSVKIKYPNNLAKGTVMVSVNGTSFTNLVGSNRYIYKVK